MAAALLKVKGAKKRSGRKRSGRGEGSKMAHIEYTLLVWLVFCEQFDYHNTRACSTYVCACVHVVQLELLNDAKEALQKVLKLDKTNATALFRMGKVCTHHYLLLCIPANGHSLPPPTNQPATARASDAFTPTTCLPSPSFVLRCAPAKGITKKQSSTSRWPLQRNPTKR